jgi:hypothetical protein
MPNFATHAVADEKQQSFFAPVAEIHFESAARSESCRRCAGVSQAVPLADG